MENTLGSGWEPSGDELETVLDSKDANRNLLDSPSRLTYGDADIERGCLRVRIGRRPIALNLGALYKRRGHPIPEEFEIYQGHHIWMLSQSLSVLRDGKSLDVSHLHYEIEFGHQTATVTEVLPQGRFLMPEGGGFRCEADIRLNGRAAAPEDAPAGEGLVENLYFGGRMVLANRDDTVGRVSFGVMTPLVQAAGAGDDASQWVFERSGEPLAGYQMMLELLLLDKHVHKLNCRIRVRAKVPGLLGIPVRIPSQWVPLEIDL
jgi:hypothetical protein